jgi:hypothetical protein
MPVPETMLVKGYRKTPAVETTGVTIRLGSVVGGVIPYSFVSVPPAPSFRRAFFAATSTTALPTRSSFLFGLRGLA